MTVGRKGSDSGVDARSSSRVQSHVGHANPASFVTTDSMSSCRIPLSSRSATVLSAADRLAAPSSSSETPVQSSVSFPAIPKKPSFHTPDSRSLPSIPMGQGGSKPSPPLPSPSTSSTTAVTKGFQAALAGGIKLKRVLVNRRKKSENVQLSGSKSTDAIQLGQDHQGRHIRVESCVPLSSSVSLQSSRGHKPIVNPSNPTLVMATDLHPLPLPPPPPPPKSPPIPPVVRQNSSLPPDQPSTLQPPTADSDNSIIPLSPGIAGAVKLIYMNEEKQERKESSMSGLKSKESPEDREASSGHEQLREKSREGTNATDMKEARRKSDSTMSYHTIRPSPTSNRTSRPVSMAESLQSNHTVKPVRISALLTDVDFTMLEEDDDVCNDTEQDMTAVSTPPSIVCPPPPPKVPQEVSRKTRNRRSLSLNPGTYPSWQTPPSASHHTTLSPSEIKYQSYSVTEGMPPPMPPSAANETPKVVETSATSQTGYNSYRSQVGHNLRGKLTSWTNPSMIERKSPAFQPRISPSPPSPPLPPLPPPPPTPPPPTAAPASTSYPPQALRAISMTSSLAPAAGRVIRGAVGRMGRAIGISSSSSNSGNNSGYSSSSSPDGYVLTRTNSNQSSFVSHTHSPLSWGRRRTPDAPSGAWSVVSSSSEIDHMAMSSAPMLGVMLRAPFKPSSGYVFGRELKAVVAASAVSVKGNAEGNVASSQIQGSPLSYLDKRFEERSLPAVVVRCAQHIFVRGIQEEGLFRVNGRAKHVATIRAEFDRGADYDMAACEPVDLDPHAVASVFKAFFRELPEPVLTAALLPFFENIVEQEMNAEVASKANRTLKPGRGPGLQSRPRLGNAEPQALKKPPSLSTLAMPSFKDMPPPSNSLLRAIKALIAQLPEENSDLLRTLIDVVNITAENEGSTKMPLANLVLVFCPTVQMTPPLLRILCEARDLWHHDDLPLEENLAVARTSSSSSEVYVDATDNMECESLLSSDGVSEDTPALSVSDYQASAEDSFDFRAVIPRSRPVRLARGPQSTVYLDAESGSSSASSSSLSQTKCDAAASRDSFSLASSQGDNALSRSSTPPMSSSTESLATPASAPGQSSLPHLPIDYIVRPEAEQGVTENLSSPKFMGNKTISDPSPVQFPSSPSTSLPSTPLKRRSIPLLSLTHFTGMNISPSAIFATSSTTSASHSSLPHKSKKPSLQILLSAKGSSSSLKGISKSSISNPIMKFDSGTAPHSASDSSASTSQSARESVFTLPPVIGTPLEVSPLGVGLSFQITPPDINTLDTDSRYRDDEDAMTIESAKLGTPIADRYRTTSTTSTTSTSSSAFSVAVAARSLPDVPKTSYFGRSLRRLTTSASSTSSNRIDFLDEDLGVEEDWTRSVLIAADIEPILSNPDQT